MDMLLFIAITIQRAVDMLLHTADYAVCSMGSVFLFYTDKLRGTVARMGMALSTDIVVAGIRMGMVGGYGTVALCLNGKGIVISGVIYINYR